MSGHSKWSKVKHQKEETDSVKGKLFTKAAQAIAIAVREGRGVREAIEKARAVNMPKDTIDRAIAGAGVAGSGGVERIIYEGYGPGGVAILIEAATDNRQRSVAAIRNVLQVSGGGLGSPGSAMYAFERSDDGYQASITIPLGSTDRAKLTALVEKLEDLDDVQRVFSNV